MLLDTAYEIATSNIRFGPGTTKEIGMDLKDRGLKRVMVLTDPNLREQAPVQTALAAIAEAGVEYALFDQVRVEPTDASFKAAIEFAQQGFDGFVAIGGGSVMDTAKAANVYTTYPSRFPHLCQRAHWPRGASPRPAQTANRRSHHCWHRQRDHGRGDFRFRRDEGQDRHGPPLHAPDLGHRRSRQHALHAAAGGRFNPASTCSHTPWSRTRPSRLTSDPDPTGPNCDRPTKARIPSATCGRWRLCGWWSKFLPRAVADPSDDEARSAMCLAAALAGIGFGNAGVHLPHGMSYPVAGMVESYVPEGYAIDYPLVPHGFAVIVNSPAVFRFTAPTCPQRHLRAAEVLGADCSGAKDEDAGAILADRIVSLMRQLDAPNGLSALGYGSQHIPALVEGTLPQHRVTKLSPRAADAEELAGIFADALSYW